jgi:hypothetical protein
MFQSATNGRRETIQKKSPVSYELSSFVPWGKKGLRKRGPLLSFPFLLTKCCTYDRTSGRLVRNWGTKGTTPTPVLLLEWLGWSSPAVGIECVVPPPCWCGDIMVLTMWLKLSGGCWFCPNGWPPSLMGHTWCDRLWMSSLYNTRMCGICTVRSNTVLADT